MTVGSEAGPGRSPRSDDLSRLAVEFWEHRLAVSPTEAMLLGDHRFDDRFEDASRAAEEANIAALRRFADTAEAIDPTGLAADDRITREVLIFEARTEADLLALRLVELDVNPAIGFQAMLPVTIGQLPIVEPEHAAAMPAKYEQLGRYLDQLADRLVDGVRAGRTPVDLLVDATVEQLDAYLATPASGDPLVALAPPPAFDEVTTARWRDALADAVAVHVRPAYARWRDVIVGQVRPAARPADRPGLCWLADGQDAYRTLVEANTSLGLDPAEVHDVGLEQVRRLAEEYAVLGREALGIDDLPTLFAALRDDPALHFDSGAEVAAASRRAVERAREAMGGWFGLLPDADCVVAETGSGPLAFYFPPAPDGSRPGTFFVNTASPARWGRYEIEAIAFHEAIPGHHLQLAIAQQLDEIPAFRQHATVTAYTEGWGLYTERLADEMGLYSGPLERIGMLSADSLRAGRLVVDTGLHAMGWSREQAIDYFLANSPLARATVEAEVDRYIGMPGQALSYMIGRLELLRLRSSAQRRLGARFDVRRFHDVVLGSGAVPLPTLGRMLDEWAAAA